ncbi:MAG: hypothetical protein BME93_04230 [Methanosarcinales archaeon Met12]|nr:MAG: hypothetical protein BME93_04230 [Methanosarcinales archaeon Met12]
MTTKYDDIRIRKVRVLGDKLKEEAHQIGLSGDDLVIVRTYINSLPTYKIEKIEGSPIEYLQRKIT